LKVMPLLFFLCLTLPLLGQESSAETIMNKHFAARGGVAKLKTLDSIRLKGVQVLMPAPMELPMLIELKRPNKQRVELVVRGMTQITTFDGKDGWIKTPWAAEKNAVPLKPEEIESLAESEFDSPYLDWQAKGWKVEYLGAAAAGGRNAYRVRFTLSNTESIVGSFDVRTYQEVQREKIYQSLGNELTLLSIFDDYQMVQGISFPFYIVHRAVNRGRRLKLLLDRIDVNPVLNDPRFAKP